MDNILHGLPFLFVYLDDMHVASSNLSQHLSHLTQLLDILQANGLLDNLSKCTFAQPSVAFLGHQVTPTGITPLSSNVDSILHYHKPQTVNDLQRFLGLINFYRRFLPHSAGLLQPLTDALQGSPRTLHWTPSMATSFQTTKSTLAQATLLSHPDPTANVSLGTDMLEYLHRDI